MYAVRIKYGCQNHLSMNKERKERNVATCRYFVIQCVGETYITGGKKVVKRMTSKSTQHRGQYSVTRRERS